MSSPIVKVEVEEKTTKFITNFYTLGRKFLKYREKRRRRKLKWKRRERDRSRSQGKTKLKIYKEKHLRTRLLLETDHSKLSSILDLIRSRNFVRKVWVANDLTISYGFKIDHKSLTGWSDFLYFCKIGFCIKRLYKTLRTISRSFVFTGMFR